MILRSLLFVPGDNERKLAKAETNPADALILDLEDSVAAERRPLARGLVKEFLLAQRDRSRRQLWVRINPLDGPDALPDLAAVIDGAPDGIILPKTNGVADILRLGYYLDALEARLGLAVGGVKIIPVATETPRALFQMGSYADGAPRLIGLTWGAEDLSTALGAVSNRTEAGVLEHTYLLARSLCLAAAAAAGIQAIDTVFTDFRNAAGLEAEARAARAAGFSGKLAIHPDQVEIIHRAFAPSAKEIEEAKRVVAAFAAHPGAGTVGLEGRMLDRPHLLQAQKILALAGVTDA